MGLCERFCGTTQPPGDLQSPAVRASGSRWCSGLASGAPSILSAGDALGRVVGLQYLNLESFDAVNSTLEDICE